MLNRKIQLPLQRVLELMLGFVDPKSVDMCFRRAEVATASLGASVIAHGHDLATTIQSLK